MKKKINNIVKIDVSDIDIKQQNIISLLLQLGMFILALMTLVISICK